MLLEVNKNPCYITQQMHRQQMYRSSYELTQPLLVVDLETLQTSSSTNEQSDIWRGSSKETCISVVIDITTGDDTNLFSFLETSKLWYFPEAEVVMVGSLYKAKNVFQESPLRNALQPLYLGLQENLLREMESSVLEQRNQSSTKLGYEELLHVYGRCLYCNQGLPKVQLLKVVPLRMDMDMQFNHFSDQMTNLEGSLIRATAFKLFPYMDFKLNEENSSSLRVTFDDCLSKRVLDTLSSFLNFRYEVHIPPDKLGGFQKLDGNWTGMMGEIQLKRADIVSGTLLTLSRLAIIEHQRVVPSDRSIIVSLNPQLLPQYLVIIRPFAEDVWASLLVTIFIWGFSLWFLQRIWSNFSRNQKMDLGEAIFYSWSVILEDPPPRSPTNSTGQMLVGWWLLTSLLLSTGFRTALVSQLAVQSKTKPIDTLADLVEQKSWNWVAQKVVLRGAPGDFFRNNPDPVVKHVVNHLELIDDLNDALVRVRNGRYSLLSSVHRVALVIALHHTDDRGVHPYYFSKNKIWYVSDHGMGFRKGAPFRRRFSQVITRLIESGIIDYWLQDIISLRVRKEKEKMEEKRKMSEEGEKDLVQETKSESDDNGQVVFRLVHVMGVFLVLCLGLGVASVAFAMEKIVYEYQQG